MKKQQSIASKESLMVDDAGRNIEYITSKVQENNKEDSEKNTGSSNQPEEPKEVLKLIKLIDVDNIIPMARNWNTKLATKRKNSAKAVVMHWVAAPKQHMFDIDLNVPSTLSWMIFTRKTASYNIAVGENGEIVIMVDPDYVAFHAGAYKYTKFGTEYFGNAVCPTHVHSKSNPHRSSPNYHSIGICMAHKDWAGNYTEKTYEAGVKAVAYVLNRYCKHLDSYNNVLCHSDLTDGKKLPCPRFFKENPAEFFKFKERVDILRKEWAKKYVEGYPTLDITEVHVTKK